MRRNRLLLVVYFCFITFVSFGNKDNSDTLKNPKDHSNEIIFVVADRSPEYPGGQLEMYKFIGQNLNQAVATKKGRVNLRFVIEIDGSIGDVEILRSLCPSCDEEAKRVIKLMPKWVPGQTYYKNVRCFYHLPIVFK